MRYSVDNWNSFATVTLGASIEEEFGAESDLDEAAEWTSFGEVRTCLEKRLTG